MRKRENEEEERKKREDKMGRTTGKEGEKDGEKGGEVDKTEDGDVRAELVDQYERSPAMLKQAIVPMIMAGLLACPAPSYLRMKVLPSGRSGVVSGRERGVSGGGMWEWE